MNTRSYFWISSYETAKLLQEIYMTWPHANCALAHLIVWTGSHLWLMFQNIWIYIIKHITSFIFKQLLVTDILLAYNSDHCYEYKWFYICCKFSNFIWRKQHKYSGRIEYSQGKNATRSQLLTSCNKSRDTMMLNLMIPKQGHVT